MNRKFLFMTMLLLLTACGKKQTIRITAVNPATGEPWSGLRYTITKQKTGAFEEKYKVIEEGFLNDNGKAETEVRMRNASYEINIQDPGNLCYINNTSYTFSKNNDNYDVTFEMAPCAHLKLKIANVNCEGATDSMVLYQRHIISDYSSNDGWLHVGCANWESNDYSDLPMGEVYYKWEVTRNGITNTFYDTLYLNTGEYKDYEINY